MNRYIQRIEALRTMMASNGWDAVIVGASDPHSSEYPATRWQQVEFLSGFTGESGDLVITPDHAGLWTDSRYFIQAATQLQGTGVELHKLRTSGTPDIPRWLPTRVVPGERFILAIDGLCQSVASVNELKAELAKACGEDGYMIVDVPDMLNPLWPFRPEVPSTPVKTVDQESVGRTRTEKIEWLRSFLNGKNCQSMLISALDEIAWLLNVRASDIEYNPYSISYLIVTTDQVQWFVRKGDGFDVDSDTLDSFEELASDSVDIYPYGDVCRMLMPDSGERLYVDPATVNWTIWSQIQENYEDSQVETGKSPIPLEKSVKSPQEISAMREAYFEDGIAMENFLYWLDSQMNEGKTLNEWEASEKLTAFRAAIPGYMGNSFENISAYGANAALPHYSTPGKGSAVLEPRGLYLVDSGGQYLFGTTDITRTVPLGECTELEKEDYTLVLKGMIQLAMAVFPEGTAGCQIDVLARNALWKARRNYGHGTGHGIGFWLGVHEGPQQIRQNFNSQPMLPGMITSDEPGLYREGMHGVRHENVILCRRLEDSEFGSWLGFETLTLTHIDTAPVVKELMTAEEINWLNSYNDMVYRRLSPRLDPHVTAWLKAKTIPL
ncbi:MAG: aminopeptidase P family protein [Bacteroidales bacterium]|nr:aminopeptidase P family protein [Bacteroidales bacterium]